MEAPYFTFLAPFDKSCPARMGPKGMIAGSLIDFSPYIIAWHLMPAIAILICKGLKTEHFLVGTK
jgi:hypothetical protein